MPASTTSRSVKVSITVKQIVIDLNPGGLSLTAAIEQQIADGENILGVAPLGSVSMTVDELSKLKHFQNAYAEIREVLYGKVAQRDAE